MRVNNIICKKNVCDVEILGETFERVEFNTKKCEECKYYSGNDDTCYVGGIIKCRKREAMYKFIYVFITCIIVSCITIAIFKDLQFNFLTKLGILILSLVPLDIVCSLIEENAPKVYEKYLYNKFKKAQNKEKELEEAEIKAQEAKKQKEEEERLAKDSQYKKVKNAEEVVHRLRTIFEQYDFGTNKKKICICVKKSEDIIKKLKERPSGYIRISQLFEVYLPEFCDTLNYYSDFIKADAIDEGNEKILTECVDTILQYLEGQRVKAIFDKDFVETQFQASATILKNVLKGEANK